MKTKQTINEHDVTMKMLNTLRNLNENQNPDEMSPAPNDAVYMEEAKKLSDTVDPRVQITRFKIYPRDRDVQLDGRLDSGINFFMSTKAMKLSVSITDPQGQATRIYLDRDLLSTIQRLNGYYENWTREWAQKLNTEYKPAQ